MAELTLQELRILGGQATFKKYGKEHYQKMAQKSKETREKKKNAKLDIV
jgi:hypothetical protein